MTVGRVDFSRRTAAAVVVVVVFLRVSRRGPLQLNFDGQPSVCVGQNDDAVLSTFYVIRVCGRLRAINWGTVTRVTRRHNPYFRNNTTHV